MVDPSYTYTMEQIVNAVDGKVGDILKQANGLICKLTGSDRSSIWFRQGTNIVTNHEYAMGFPEALGTYEMPLTAHGIAPYVVRQGQPIASSELHRYPKNEEGEILYDKSIEDRTGYVINTMATYPIRGDHGAIQVMNNPNGYTNIELRVLGFMSVFIGRCIESALKGELVELSESEQPAIETMQELRNLSDSMSRLIKDEKPEMQGFNVYGRHLPSASMGGDFYAAFKREISGQPYIGIALADAFDHGVNAVTEASSISSYYDFAIAQGQRNPSSLEQLATTVIEGINYTASSQPDPIRATMCLGFIQPDGRLIHVSAGHPPPLIYKASTKTFIEDDKLIEKAGIVFGALEEAEYPAYTTTLEKGDIVLYTSDGAFECFNRTNEMLGRAGLKTMFKEVIETSPPSTPIEEIVNELVSRLLGYTNGRLQELDDVTLVGLKRN